jgi:flagellar biogenesis protein FliO
MAAVGLKAEPLARFPAGLGEKIRAWILRRPARQLRLCESLSLGEKRLVAVLQFEGQRYLVGATGASITLLSKLPDSAGCSAKGEACEG